MRDFLLQTSILERLCAPLCDAVTGSDDGGEQLEAADRSNLFLIPLDGRREWFRYHHLFRDLLRHELTLRSREVVNELHRRASGWHRQHGDVDEAIHHATAARDFGDAGELIARHWRPVWSSGQVETVAGWVDALPRGTVLADARLCLARGWAALYLNLVECDRWRRAAEVATLPGPFYDGTSSVEEGAAILQAAHANLSGDVGGAMEAARRALALPNEGSPARGIASVHLGMAAYYAGEPTVAEEAFGRVLRSLTGERWASAVVTAIGNLAAVHLDAGELERAEEAAAEAERVIDELRVHEAPFTCRYWIARGKLLETRGELAPAEAAFERAVTLARRVDSHLVVAHGLLALANLRRRRGAHAEARRLAREARALLAGCRDIGIVGDLLSRTERALQLTPRTPETELAVDAELSDRELTVLRLLASELSQREIGSELYISLNTVKGHTRSIFRKLGVSSRAEAVARARALALL